MDKTRQKIIDATMNLIMEKGYASMTTKDIAKYARVNESTLFRKFKNKKDIVLCAMEENWHPHLSSDDFYPTSGDLYHDLCHFACVYMSKVTPQFVKISIGLRSPELFDDTAEGIMKVPQVFKEVLIQYFLEMQKLDKIIQTDIESLAVAFLSMMFGFVFLKASFDNQLMTVSQESYIKNSVAVFVKGIEKV